MDVRLVLFSHGVAGFFLGLAVWLVFWVTIWTKLAEYTERIVPNGRLDWTLVGIFFLSLPATIVGLTVFLAFLYLVNMTLPFVLFVTGIVFVSWFTYRFSLPPALPVEIDT